MRHIGLMIVDTHFHTFPAGWFSAGDIPSGASKISSYPVSRHLDQLAALGEPKLLLAVPVGFAPDPQLMFENLRQAERWKRESGNDSVRVLALLAMDPAFHREGLFARPGVAGARLSVENGSPDALRALGFPDGEWAGCFEFFARTGRQLHIRATRPDTLRFVLESLRPDLTVALDHFGLAAGQADPSEPGFRSVLETAAARGNVFFKGPGFRTSLDPSGTAPMVETILRICGPESVWLGATDAPFLWSDAASGRPLQELIPSARWAVDYVRRLSRRVCDGLAGEIPLRTEDLLGLNALRVFERKPV